MELFIAILGCMMHNFCCECLNYTVLISITLDNDMSLSITALLKIVTTIYSRLCACAKSLQLCLTLSDPVDCTPPGSFSHGILQARILEWAAMPSSRGASQPRD